MSNRPDAPAAQDGAGGANGALRDAHGFCGLCAANLLQICRRFEIGSLTLSHVRQPCRDHPALAFGQVTAPDVEIDDRNHGSVLPPYG